MPEYIVVVEEPKGDDLACNEVPTAQTYPMIIELPPARPRNVAPGILAYRNENPEEWIEKNILSKHPSSVVNVYQRRATYEPSTHKRKEFELNPLR